MKLIGRSFPAQPQDRQIPVEEAAEDLPYLVRRDSRLAAAFFRKDHAVEWAEMRSYGDESRFAVHTERAVLAIFKDGEDVRG
jgi:hypothetical protein